MSPPTTTTVRQAVCLWSAIGLSLLAGCQAGPPPLTLTPGERAAAPTLRIGDPAPTLKASAWVAGDPVAGYAAGTVYVIDFWATWCGPCIASMPLLAEAQRQHQGKLVAIAMTTIDDENTPPRINRMVRSRADAWGVDHGLRVAIDDGDSTAKSFRTAVRDTALPRSFVVDQQGRLAWWGHPADAAPVIDAVVAGTWDLPAAQARFDAAAEDATRSAALAEQYIAAIDRGDKTAALAAAQAVCNIDVAHVKGMSPPWWAWPVSVALLRDLGRGDEAATCAQHAAETNGIRDEPMAIRDLVCALPPSEQALRQRLAERGLALVEQQESALARNSWDEYLHDADYVPHAYVFVAAADVFADAGDHQQASELLRRALERWPADPRIYPSRDSLVSKLNALSAPAPRAGS